VQALEATGPLIIGGKSMGGRVASMVADDLQARDEAVGLLCIGYPFHPLSKPDALRTAHLAQLKTPALIAQGTRDPFGARDEVATYALSPTIEILWLEDGDHDLRPRKSVPGFTAQDHLDTLARHAGAWARQFDLRSR
jgi:predicted alpha/beta-hydrolase family hydrolase